MKLKYEMTRMDIDGKYMAVPLCSDKDFNGILRMNGTTADILELLKTETTEDAIVAALLQEYNADEAAVRKSVTMVLDKLRKKKLLVE